MIAVFRPTRAGDADAVLRCVRILRAVQAVIERRDCGTGAGGFKPGNKCGAGGGGGDGPDSGSGDSGGSGESSSSKSSGEHVSAIKQLGFTVSSEIAKADAAVTSTLASSLEKLKSDFLGVDGALANIRDGRLPKDVPLTLRVDQGVATLIVDTEKLSGNQLQKTLDEISKAQSSGQLASRDGLRGIIEHELAHVIDKAPFRLRYEWKGISEAKKYIKQNPPKAKDLSKYAVKAGPHQQEEAWAEAFSAWRTNSSPTPWQQKFNEVISQKSKK